MKATRGNAILGSKPSKSTDPSPPLLGNQEPDEVMLLGKGDSTLIAKALEMPELHAELERAIWQVQTDINTRRKLREGNQELKKSEEKQEDQVKDRDQDKK